MVGPDVSINDTEIEPGATLDLAGLAYVPGATVSLDTPTDLLTIYEGGVSTTLQLFGNYANDRFGISSDLGMGTFGLPAGTDVTLTGPTNQYAAPNYVYAGGGSFLNAGASGTIGASVASAQTIAGYAHYYLSTASVVGNASPGVSTTDLDAARGDIAVFSTPNRASHTILATGTGRSVIAAGGGNDTVTVTNGNDDLIATGVGANTLYLQTGTSQVRSEGTDTINVGAGADQIEIGGTGCADPVSTPA